MHLSELNSLQFQYQIFLKLSENIVYDYDVTTGNIVWDGSIEAVTGFKAEEFKNVNIHIWTSLIHPDDTNCVITELDKAMLNKSEFNLSYRFKHKKGYYFYIHDRGVFFYNESGRAVRMLGIMKSIDEQKLVENALISSERRFHLFYKISNEAMLYIHSKTYKLIEVNDRFFEIFGYEKDEIKQLTLFNLFKEEDTLRIQNWLSTHQNEALNTFAVRKNKEMFPVVLRSLREVFNGNPVIFLNILDVTAYHQAAYLKRANEEILANQKELELKKNELEETLQNIRRAQKQLIFSEKMIAIEQVISGIAHEINNPLGSIKASCEIIKESFMETLSNYRNISKLLTELKDQEFKNYFDWILENSFNTEFLQGKHEKEIKKQISEYLESLGVVQIAYLLENLVDLNATKKLELVSFLFQKEKWKDLWNFAFFLINVSRNLYIIENSVNRASKIIFSLRNLSRIKQDEAKTKINIIKSIEVVLSLYENSFKKGVKLIKEYEEVPEIFCYADTIPQLWTNLIFNSLQAMNFKGVLKISVKNLEQFIEVSISDTGHGIPQEIQNKIFEPFFTTKKFGEGTGLGLTIVKNIIEQHEGKIEFSSNMNGTSFSVFLPKSDRSTINTNLAKTQQL